MGIDELVARFGATVYRLAYMHTADHQAAEDVCQEVFVAAYRHLGTIRHPRAWLTRATVHRARNVLRSRRRHPIEPLSEDVPDPAFGPGGRDGDLVAAVQGLADIHREAVLLVYYQGFSIEDAARILRLPAGTLRSRLHRARAELRLRLREEADAENA